MNEEPAQPIVLDTTVLSNFASVDAIDWLIGTFERPIVVPAVRDELEEGEDAGHMFLTAAIDPLEDELPVHQIADAKSADHPDYVAPLDPGESESLRAAEEQDGTLASDDHKAREIAEARGITVTGSVGILGRGVKRDELDIETADEWLDTWIDEFGYRSPIEHVGELFEENDS